MGDVGDAYVGCKARIADLVRGLDTAEASTVVPTCPEWTVHDVVAHVVGVVADAMAGRLDGVATDPWTAAQVEARRGESIAAMLDEWDAGAETFASMLDAIGDPGRQAVADLVTHEHDIRCALASPGARTSDAVHIGLGFIAPALVSTAAAQEVSLRVRALDGPTFGGDEAAVTLAGPCFDLLRAGTGRRSVDQLLAMDWDGDPKAALPAFTFGPFRPALSAIAE
jgi:uncharacterized protein (TIGR03083 family)